MQLSLDFIYDEAPTQATAIGVDFDNCVSLAAVPTELLALILQLANPQSKVVPRTELEDLIGPGIPFKPGKPSPNLFHCASELFLDYMEPDLVVCAGDLEELAKLAQFPRELQSTPPASSWQVPVFSHIQLLVAAVTRSECATATRLFEATHTHADELLWVRADWVKLHPPPSDLNIYRNPQVMTLCDYLLQLSIVAWNPGLFIALRNLGLTLDEPDDMPNLAKLALTTLAKYRSTTSRLTMALDWFFESDTLSIADHLLKSGLVASLLGSSLDSVLEHLLDEFTDQVSATLSRNDRARLVAWSLSRKSQSLELDLLEYLNYNNLLDAQTWALIVVETLRTRNGRSWSATSLAAGTKQLAPHLDRVKFQFAAIFGEPTETNVSVLFELATRILSRAGLAHFDDFAPAHWIAVAALQDFDKRPAALQLLQQTGTASKFLGMMIMAQVDCGGRHIRAFLPIDHNKSDRTATLAADVRLSKLPRQRRRYETGCAWHQLPQPSRELVRALIGADFGAVLDIVASESLPTCADFWRLVPDGALDRVRDAQWISQSVLSLKGQKADECVKEIERAAFRAVQSKEYKAALKLSQ
ncbi:hypothetical protein H9P43_005122 [Blastocladiella emersonii ATCC 22665]|nr:hypothetical protein H9P43_005122 [Blastocladiella emersonii ATCC 22665]